MNKFVERFGWYGSDWFLENDEGDVAWVAPMVKEHIERIEDENAKLRELAQDMGELLDVLTECSLACKHYHDGCIGDCYYVNARRELGIEVSE